MWFIFLVVSIGVLWLLYVLVQNTSESLAKQQAILSELNSLSDALNRMRDGQSDVASSKVVKADKPVKNVDRVEGTVSESAAEESDNQDSVKLNINEASTTQLQALPGIGKVVAQKIVDARPFNSVDELAKVSGVSEELLEKLRVLVTL